MEIKQYLAGLFKIIRLSPDNFEHIFELLSLSLSGLTNQRGRGSNALRENRKKVDHRQTANVAVCLAGEEGFWVGAVSERSGFAA